MKVLMTCFLAAAAAFAQQPIEAIESNIGHALPPTATVTIQISLSQADYTAIEEMLPKIVRTVVEPVPEHPDQQRATTVPIYNSPEDFLNMALRRAIAESAKHYGTSRTQAAKDALARKQIELQQQAAEVEAAAAPGSITVSRK